MGEHRMHAYHRLQFISHDGITTFTELVDAMQNMYNMGYDLAVFLATVGVSMDGDIITGKVSIGCDATSRTSLTGSLLGNEAGFNSHNVCFQLFHLTNNFLLSDRASRLTLPSREMIIFWLMEITTLSTGHFSPICRLPAKAISIAKI